MADKMAFSSRGWKAPFFTVWAGQAVSLLGSRLVQFALVWWLTESTQSATVLATATLVALLPGVFVAPFAGALIDRWNRRAVMIVGDGLVALSTVVLAVLFALGAADVWHVYVVMFFRALVGVFHWSAMQASTALMVPEEQLSRVAGLNQTLYGGMSIVAPPLGALLLALLPLQGVLAVDVVTATCAISLLLLVRIPQPEREEPGLEEPGARLLSDVREGLRYVVNWPGLMAVLIMAMAINFLFTPAFSLLPLLVTKHFGGEALELGWLQSAWGIGVVVGGLILSAWGGFRRRVFTSLMGLVGLGLGVLVVGLTPATAFWLALGSMFVAGSMNPIVNGPLFAVVQAKVAPRMHGRVFTLMQSGSSAMAPLGMVIAGPVADWLGVRVWYVVAGALCLAMGAGSFFLPVITRMEENHKDEPEEAPRPSPASVGEPG